MISDVKVDIPQGSQLAFETIGKKGGLVMGRQKKQLETSLDYREKKSLKKAIDLVCKEYKHKVDSKYTDNFS